MINIDYFPVPTSGADAGDIEESYLMYTEDEKISLCLQHCDRYVRGNQNRSSMYVGLDVG